MMQSKGKVINAGSYPVYIDGNLPSILENFLLLPAYKKSKVFVLADENTSSACASELMSQTSVLSSATLIGIPAGEKHKNIETCTYVWRKLIREQADRHSLLINVGGGMVTDLGGFVAATYKRGIRYINIPTSLVGQIDAALGGKVGVDHDNLKNQIGMFFDPQAVIIQTRFLESLPEEGLLEGFAEMAKHGLVADAIYWHDIRKMDPVDTTQWPEIVSRSVDIKISVVRADPYERKYRKVLNFGHTVGHALESFHLRNTNISLPHGVAVAAGMVCEAFLSARLAGLSPSSLLEIVDFIGKNFPVVTFHREDIPAIVGDMHNDKKNEGGEILFTLLPVIGHALVNRPVEEALISESMEYYLEKFAGR